MKSKYYYKVFLSFWVGIFTVISFIGHSQITISGDPVICNSNKTIITAYAEGAASYQWSIGAVTPSITITQAGTYSVTVVYINGNSSSRNIIILDSKMVSNLQLDMCKNSTTSISPTFAAGYWTANNPQVATITSDGRMTAVEAGKATFSFHFDNSTCVAETKPFEVFPLPEVSSSKEGYCMEDVIKLSPSQGGTWSSMQTQLAKIKNNGEGTPLAPGNPKFIFTSSETGCSQTLENVVIYPRPKVELIGNDTLCLYSTALIKPNSGGIWKGLNHSVGTVTNGGVITVIGLGTTQFQWEETSTGCLSELSPIITVIPRPKITTHLPATICLGGDKITLPSPFAGTWTSSNPTIANINQEGVIEILKAGNVAFEIYAQDYSCSSEPITFTFQKIKPAISSHVVKQNSFIDLDSDASGTWTSIHPGILAVAENQKAIAYRAGNAKLEYVADAGCFASFSIEVKAGKIGSNADLNPGGFTNNPENNAQFTPYELQNRKIENQANLTSHEISIYPNPVQEVIYINNCDFDRIEVRDISGALRWQSDQKVTMIDVFSWDPALYVIQFIHGNQPKYATFLKL